MPKAGRKNTKNDNHIPSKDVRVPVTTTVAELKEDSSSDKAKNSSESQTEPKLEQKYRKRVIHDNWAKYDEVIISEDSTTEGVHEENDFSFLANRVTSLSYFQTSNEKEWDKGKLAADNIFQLDLKRLSAGLSSIPIYKRIGLEEKDLTKADIERCNYFAEKSLQRYEPIRNDIIKSRVTKIGNRVTVEDKTKLKHKAEETNRLTQHLSKNENLREVDIVKNNAIEKDSYVGNESQTHAQLKHCIAEGQVLQVKHSSKSEKEASNINNMGEVSIEEQSSPEDDLMDQAIGSTISDFTESLRNMNIPSRSKEKQPEVVSTDENLEDWLDSVLDS